MSSGSVGSAARTLLVGLVVALAGCETLHRPTSFTLTPDDMERRIQTDLGGMFEAFRGVGQRRPEVSLMPVSGRLQLDWTVTLPGVNDEGGIFGGNGVGVGVALSGRPELDDAGTTVVLRDVRVEDVRINGVPRMFSFGLGQLVDRKGATVPDLPLFGIEGQLKRSDVAYAASGLEVTYSGLRVDIAPK